MVLGSCISTLVLRLALVMFRWICPDINRASAVWNPLFAVRTGCSLRGRGNPRAHVVRAPRATRSGLRSPRRTRTFRGPVRGVRVPGAQPPVRSTVPGVPK